MADGYDAASSLACAPPIREIASDSWATYKPELSVVVATHEREHFLAELVAALAAQASGPPFDVVLVDDASTDTTWDRLESLVAGTTLPVLALRLEVGMGPSVARNTAAMRSRGRWLAFTDDDCLPEPTWLRALSAATDGVGIVQGCTRPVVGPRPTRWARTIDIPAPTALYETCNLAVNREIFLAQGGFPVLGLLPGPMSRGFGEDAVLGARMAEAAGGAFAADAVVRHRWLPGTYADHLRGEWRLVGFPALLDLVPELGEDVWHRVFLTRRTAEADLAIAGVLAGAWLRRGWPLAAAVPWIRRRVKDARQRQLRPLTFGAGQLMVADLVRLVALVHGSKRAKRLLI